MNRKLIVGLLIAAIVIGSCCFFYSRNNKKEVYQKEYLYRFFAHKEGDDVIFYEPGLLMYLSGYNLYTNSDASLEELEESYYSRNELFDNYISVFALIKPDNIKETFSDISERELGKSYFDISLDEAKKINDIFLDQQSLVTDYYGDSRILLYNLSDEQQEEFYKKYEDSSYVIEDSVMETTEPYTGHKHREFQGIVKEINGNEVVIRVLDGKRICQYSGIYDDISFDIQDYVAFDFYFFKTGIEEKTGSEWTGVEFENIKKIDKPKNFDIDAYYADEYKMKRERIIKFLIVVFYSFGIVVSIVYFSKLEKRIDIK